MCTERKTAGLFVLASFLFATMTATKTQSKLVLCCHLNIGRFMGRYKTRNWREQLSFWAVHHSSPRYERVNCGPSLKIYFLVVRSVQKQQQQKNECLQFWH